MTTINSIITGAAAVGNALASVQAARKTRRLLSEQEKENEDWFQQRYHEDGTQRADAQRMITKTTEALLRTNRNAQASAAVTGATPEQAAITQRDSNRMLAEGIAKVVERQNDRQDNVEDEYRRRKRELQNTRLQLETNNI